MKIRIDRDVLVEALGRAIKVVPRSPVLPVLICVRMYAERDRLTLTTTDIERFLEIPLSVEVQEGGGIAVPAQRLYRLVKELPGGDLEIATQEERFTIRTESGVFELTGLDGENFPVPHVVEGERLPSIEGLRAALDAVSIAVSNDHTRNALCGVHLGFHDWGVVVEATDGYILGQVKVIGEYESGDVILARDTVTTLDADFTSMEVGENVVRFEYGDGRIFTVRQLEGPYPVFEQVIRVDNDKCIVFRTVELQRVLRRMGVVCDSETRAITLAISAGRVEISASSDTGAKSEEDLEVEYQGEELIIGFSVEYARMIVERIKTEQVEWTFSEPDKPSLIRPVGDDNMLYLLVPMCQKG